MAPSVKISIVVPCYNEEKIILDTYREIKKEIEKITNDYEIIFANDGSTDDSLKILEKISKKDKKIKLISWFPNSGKGYAYRHLYKIAFGSIIIEIDVDLSIKPKIFKEFIKEIEEVDVVIASRYAGIKGKIPLYRKLPSRLNYLICKLLFGIKVRDVLSGFVVFRKEVLDSINLESDGFGIHIELIAKIHKRGFRIKEIPAQYIHRVKDAKFSIFKDGLKTLFRTFTLWLQLRKISDNYENFVDKSSKNQLIGVPRNL